MTIDWLEELLLHMFLKETSYSSAPILLILETETFMVIITANYLSYEAIALVSLQNLKTCIKNLAIYNQEQLYKSRTKQPSPKQDYQPF